jgi:CRISPR-associated endoribonuclease Cas6
LRLTINLEGNTIAIPIHYNYLIQSFIYNHISPKLSDFLHTEGYVIGKRRFAMFTFSRLLGKFRIHLDDIEFSPPIKLIVSSPIDQFIQEFAETLIKAPSLKFGDNVLHVASVEVQPRPKLKEKFTMRMLSPVTVYSTLSKADGKKKTYYYSPFEDEFKELIEQNIKKKYQALYKSEPTNLSLRMFPKNIERNAEKIINYKGTIIKGWMGTYTLMGSEKLIFLAYDAGLGGKNAQGFGMFEITD